MFESNQILVEQKKVSFVNPTQHRNFSYTQTPSYLQFNSFIYSLFQVGFVRPNTLDRLGDNHTLKMRNMTCIVLNWVF